MTERKRWPSVPKALADALYQEFGSGSTRIPAGFTEADLPIVQVTRNGGYDNRIEDNARVDVVVIASTEDEAETLAENIRSYFADVRPIRGAGLLLDEVTTEVAPYRVFYGDGQNPERTQYLASYVVKSRRF